MGRRAFTISLLAFLGFVILQTVSADEPSEELAAQLNSNAGSLLEPSENQFRLVRSPDRRPKRKNPNGRKSKRKPGFKNKNKRGNKNPNGRKSKRKPNGRKSKRKPGFNKGGNKNPNGRKSKRKPNGRKSKRKPGFNKGGNKKKGGKEQGNGIKGGNTRREKGKKGSHLRPVKTNPPKKRNGNKKPSGKKGKLNVGGKQGDTCDETELCKRIKLYIKYSNQQRKAKRIQRTCKTMKSKHDKAGTEFEATAAAIKNSDDTNVTAIQATLANCKTTAKALCADTNVEQCSAAEQTKIEACVTKLKTWIEAFGPGKDSCLGQATCCTCINNISPAAPDDCLNYDDIDKESLKKKNKCTKSEEKGSFGDCRKQQQLAAEQGPPAFGKKCKNGAVTTAKPSGRKKKAVIKIRKELNIKK